LSATIFEMEKHVVVTIHHVTSVCAIKAASHSLELLRLGFLNQNTPNYAKSLRHLWRDMARLRRKAASKTGVVAK